MSVMEISPQFEQVLDFVNRTSQLIFLTGKAGTGKTTLLKYIKQNTYKQMAIVAPTGVAAINAGGSTIHSFFQFAFAPFIPLLKENGELEAAKALPVLKYNAQRLAVFRNLELLVIDEVSMVRADLLDQIDVTLRQARKKWHLPFGGVQVLLIGDMYQLPPVVQQEEWKLLSAIYPSVYFFDSLVMRRNPPVYIELDKIYRQNEQAFINLLNKVRNNELDQQSLDLLNAHYKSELTKKDYAENITLTTHNRKADEINQKNLDELAGKAFTFKCKIEGSFSEKSYPAEETLVLKKGTRVMFLKNNPEKNYYNGKIGIVSFVDKDQIRVKCGEDKAEIEVNRETWNNVAYKMDKSTKHVDEEVIGTFSQYPLRLAWAITIHKSQGLTFDKLIIDAAASFSAGQVYVALSRCRSLSGLILSSRISRQSLLNDHTVINFSAGKQDADRVKTIFNSSQRNYVKTVLTTLFDLSSLTQDLQELGDVLQLYKNRINADGFSWAAAFQTKIETLNEVSRRFNYQLSNLVDNAAHIETDTALQTRLKQAAVYFDAEFSKCLQDLKNCSLVTESKEAAEELNVILQQDYELLYQKQNLSSGLVRGFVFSEFVKQKLNLRYPDFKMNVYASAKNARVSAEVKYPALYRELLLQRDKICNEEQTPIYLVANNKTLLELTNLLPDTPGRLLKISGFGQAKVEAYGAVFLRIIKNYMQEHQLETKVTELLKKEKKRSSAKKTEASGEKKLSTKEQTYLLYTQGLKLEEIAQQRGYSLSTIQSHLIPYITNGEIPIDDLVSRDKQKLITKALEQFNYEEGLNPVKNNLPDSISFTEIRYMLAHRLKEH